MNDTRSGEDTGIDATDKNERPLCSVLSCVINNVMVPATPLETEEYNDSTNSNTPKPGNSSLLVPVLRVFGPIIRGDAPSGVDPVQSACLFIHGAFPYMLARPVTAGPDGSLHHSSHLMRTNQVAGQDQVPFSLTSSGHVDWDNPDAIKSIATAIGENLESVLQASVVSVSNKNDDRGEGSSNGPKAHNGNARPPPKFIRSVTVVMGRGFYTYCPGPPAPFLRVEYYDPKMRWKVKLMLERGLDLPRMYHPDPQQYDAVGMVPAADSSQLGLDPLSFHCYEAHIPYTMQFFKDWNLAGASYIHISKGKFRQNMPSSVRRRWEPDENRDSVGNENCDDESEIEKLAFLSCNTPKELIWDRAVDMQEKAGDDASIAVDEEGVSSATTSSLHDDLQSLDIKPSLNPPLSQGKQLPYWGAKETSCDVEIDVHVSSIMNIRSIITALPQDETESQNIHWRAVPSLREIWQEERRRMAKLLEPKHDFLSRQSDTKHETIEKKAKSPPRFTLSVKKGASNPGARLAARGMKRLLRVTKGLEHDFMRALSQIVERHASAISRVDGLLLKPSPNAQNVPSASRLSRSDDATASSQMTPSVDDAVGALDALAAQEFDQTPDPHEETSNSSDASASADSEQEVLGEEDCKTEQLSSQMLGSSDTGNDGGFSNLSQSYYGLHRAPRKQITEKSSFDLSQRIDRGDVIVDGPFLNIEDFIDPQTLAPFDSFDDDDGNVLRDAEGKELDEAGMELELTRLATQMYNQGDNAPLPRASATNSFGIGGGTEGSGNSEKSLIDVSTTQEFVPDVPNSDSSTSHHDDLSAEEQSSDESFVQSARATQVKESKVTKTRRNKPLSKPPSRISVVGLNACLKPLPSSRETPSWLGYVKAYDDFLGADKMKSKWTPPIPTRGLYIQPTRPPPRRDEVLHWCRQEAKRGLPAEGTPARKKVKVGAVNKAKDFASATHKVDDNTGKVILAGQKVASPNDGGSNMANWGRVEEVRWLQSQTQTSAMSQEKQQEQKKQLEGKHVNAMCPPARTAKSTPATVMDSQSFVAVAADLSSGSPLKLATGQGSPKALKGMQNQGGKLVVEGGGQLKARTRPTQSGDDKLQKTVSAACAGYDDRYLPSPLTMMSIEVHVQCRVGRAGVSTAHEMAMTPDPDRDKVYAVAYAFARDPGGGAALEILERGCLYVPLEQDSGNALSDMQMKSSLPRKILGVSSPLSVESVKDERQLLLRLASIVRWKDPDMLLSWDTQGAGLGYIVERGAKLGNQACAATSEHTTNARSSKLDMARLLGRLPKASGYDKAKGGMADDFFKGGQGASSGVAHESNREGKPQDQATWAGSGLGADWDDRVGAGQAAASIAGRLTFAGWKIIAEEVKHPNYSSLCAMVSAVLSKRIPYHDELNLTNWYACIHGRERWRVLHHRLAQCTATVLLFDALDIIGRAGEAARLSGVEFSQSFPGIRGSQYKVEGVLLRALQSLDSEERGSKRGKQTVKAEGAASTSLSEESKSQAASPWKTRRKGPSSAQPENVDTRYGYFFFSPSLQDTEKQEALEVQALTLEPQSGHYSDPIVVCDFTALYPSLVIAYNLCYSTCAGKLWYHSTRPEMLMEGKTTGRLGPFRYPENRTATVLRHHLKSFNENSVEADGFSSKDRAYVAPTGTIYVSEAVVKGVLPQVLDELLSTRAMLKKASKEYKKRVPGLSPSILRQLEARQLALKYVANVTYGYTSATFSGRCAMPVLADTIVECGRRTLSHAIRLANSWGQERGGKWEGAEVLYGDTDSVFVKLPGRSVEEAFDFGELFCRTVTANNPPPVQLKLEKVYLGSILQTKKKYCGMKFESRETKNPEFEAKGIETIRRDQCALTQKILQNSLIMLFRHGTVAVKDYLYRQWSLIMAERLPVSDFILTGRVRSRYRNGSIGPVQAALFRRLAESDPGLVMKQKERISYVIVATPGVSYKLRECVLTPMELLAQWDAYTIHSSYYIKKHVNAALQRCFGLAPHFIDINAWFESCPKPRRRIHFWPVTRTGSSSMISAYFGSDMCSLCGKKCKAQGRARAVVCSNCKEDDVKAALTANRKLQKLQHEANVAARICSNCNLCFEDSTSFAPLQTFDNGIISTTSTRVPSGTRQGVAVPLAACTCIDCPNTYKRHKLREESLEAEAICRTLGIIP